MHRSRILAAALMPLLIAACGSGTPEQGAGAGGPPGPGGPPTLVDAVTVEATQVPNIIELPGRIEAVRTSEVRARADGIIERRLFTEGGDVRAGQALFRIDPRDLRAAAAQAQAALDRAQAARANAAQVVRRYAPLVNERAVSGQENDQAVATLRQADAAVAEARATLTRARLQLGYTTVTAPISGRIGRAQVTEGALVSAAGGTLLATIEQSDPIYASFAQSNTAMLNLLQNANNGVIDVTPLRSVEVRLVLANGREYGAVGRLDFASPMVDPETGNQTLRAVFPNQGRILLPGQFVRGRVAIGTIPNGIVLPAAAMQFSDRGTNVSVVGADGSVAIRPVQLAGQTATGWIVRSGVRPGERVITNGWQKLQPGMRVQVRAARAQPQAAPRPSPAAAGQPASGR